MDPKIYQTVVAPTLSTGAAFIGITTLGDDTENNFVGELINVRDKDGERLFRVINIDLVCDKCRRTGKEDVCQHKMGEVPYWQDERRHADIQKMMPADVFQREMRGIQSNPYISPFFNPTALDRLERDADRVYYSDNHVRYIFISVDPAAGGDHSKYAVVSCIYESHKVIVSWQPPAPEPAPAPLLLPGAFVTCFWYSSIALFCKAFSSNSPSL